MSDEPQTLCYFGYGSNMDPRTFLGRRRMRPLESRIARLKGWQLCFDLPVGPGARGVANLRERPGESVWGLCYRLGLEDAARLDRSEGVPRAYRRVAVDLRLAGGDARAAYTLVSELRQAGRKPSRRYLGLLLAGARHHGLPAEYVTYLRRFELAVDERQAQGELF